MVRVAVIGAGAWGINHVRAFVRSKGAQLSLVCDASEACRERARTLAPHGAWAGTCARPWRLTTWTPLSGNAGQGSRRACALGLASGQACVREKPLALNAGDAQAVVALAEARHLTLMVGHLMLYHPAVARLKAMISAGELGRIFYVYSLRVNLGRVRQDENALWSLAPHDVSMISHCWTTSPSR